VEKLRLGVIGTGSVVREIYEYLYFRSEYSPLISVEAVCDRSEENMRIIENITRFRNGNLAGSELEKLMDPFSLGFYTSLVCEGAHRSLEAGHISPEGVVTGSQIYLREFPDSEIGEATSLYFK
jgi:hypothetical protein